jgi:hypothetical protein
VSLPAGTPEEYVAAWDGDAWVIAWLELATNTLRLARINHDGELGAPVDVTTVFQPGIRLTIAAAGGLSYLTWRDPSRDPLTAVGAMVDAAGNVGPMTDLSALASLVDATSVGATAEGFLFGVSLMNEGLHTRAIDRDGIVGVDRLLAPGNLGAHVIVGGAGGFLVGSVVVAIRVAQDGTPLDPDPLFPQVPPTLSIAFDGRDWLAVGLADATPGVCRTIRAERIPARGPLTGDFLVSEPADFRGCSAGGGGNGIAVLVLLLLILRRRAVARAVGLTSGPRRPS